MRKIFRKIALTLLVMMSVVALAQKPKGRILATGGAIASPFVQMGQAFQKQSNLLWYEIFDIVKQNCTTTFSGSPQEDRMERLLRSRKRI